MYSSDYSLDFCLKELKIHSSITAKVKPVGIYMVKNSPANAGELRDAGLIPGSGRYPGGGNDNPLQYTCLENPMDRGAWQATTVGSQRVGHD